MARGLDTSIRFAYFESPDLASVLALTHIKESANASESVYFTRVKDMYEEQNPTILTISSC